MTKTVCLLLLFTFVASAIADTNDRIVAQAQAKENPKPRSTVSPDEAAVMTFVRLHHPELEELLIHLRDARPNEYDKALRKLFRVTERLGQIQDRDMELYELELRLWKSQSRLQLLLVRMQMNESEGELKKQIKEAVEEQFETKVAMLERQEKKATEQARKAQEDLKKLKADREKWISRQVESFTRPTSESPGENVKPKAPAGKPSGKEPERQDDKKPESKPAKPKEAKPGK